MRRLTKLAAASLLWPALTASAPADTETVLHRFTNGADGAYPDGGLTLLDGTLYGTTNEGGSGCGNQGCGTIFAITSHKTITTLFPFMEAAQGAYPSGHLLALDGALYGTTQGGGSQGSDTIFSLTPQGAHDILHNFSDGHDGSAPLAGVIAFRDTVYGTTANGGQYGLGTVFSLTPSRVETPLFIFGEGTGESGLIPAAGLTRLGDLFYGTTEYGGSSTMGCGGIGCGVAYSITAKGVQTVLHSFGHGTDGAYPLSGLTDLGGLLYGTTSTGGSANAGAVFSLSPAGEEKLVYSFAGGADGANPAAGLLVVGGALYGTTEFGGGSATCQLGCGTVFKVTPGGEETLLHLFTGGRDGAYPLADLTQAHGRLYGTTAQGGYGRGKSCKSGCGTVFTVRP